MVIGCSVVVGTVVIACSVVVIGPVVIGGWKHCGY